MFLLLFYILTLNILDVIIAFFFLQYIYLITLVTSYFALYKLDQSQRYTFINEFIGKKHRLQ